MLSDLALPPLDGMPLPVGRLSCGDGSDGSVGFAIDLIRGVGRPGGVPDLELRYDGVSNGVFGRGWALSTPSIRRGAGRRLVRYRDEGADADRYTASLDGELVEREPGAPREIRDGVEITRFRPRVEGRFARIERWRDLTSGQIHWLEMTGSGVTRVYGRSASCRIADPDNPTRVSEWLLEEEHNSLGHVLSWEYKAEDMAGLTAEMVNAEQGRAAGPGPTRYPKRLRWGNQVPGVAGDELFELVFDYGEHPGDMPTAGERASWTPRPDCRSHYRDGFEQRIRRLCRRVLLFTRVAELVAADGSAALLRTIDLDYDSDPTRTLLVGVTLTGFRRDDGRLRADTLPTLRLGYTSRSDAGPVRQLCNDRGAPLTDVPAAQWLDLDADGLPGLLFRDSGGALRYRRNLGGGQFGSAQPLTSRPALTDARPAPRLDQPFGDARTALIESRAGHGFQDRSNTTGWAGWAPFGNRATSAGVAARAMDLTGDGLLDVVAAGQGGMSWQLSTGRAGWAPAESASAPTAAAAIQDRSGTVLQADMTGDGLADLVQVLPGSVRYWPNLGYGRFGAPIVMARAPVLAGVDEFRPDRVRLVDIDGSGTADLLYLAGDGVRCWRNRSGNSFDDGEHLGHLPSCCAGEAVEVVDVLGTGLGCLVWTPNQRNVGASARFVELATGSRPYLLATVDAGTGGRTDIRYTTSTEVMLADAARGHPWRATSPLALPLVAQVTDTDEVTGSVVQTTFAYRHGVYDDIERELNGFGFVEQRRSETWPPAPADRADGWQPPVRQICRWFHTGLSDDGTPHIDALTDEYFAGDSARPARPGVFVEAGPGVSSREAMRALRGRLAREETYCLDDDTASVCPRSTVDYGYVIRPLQAGTADGAPASVVAFEQNVVRRTYERIPDDPCAEQVLTLELDEVGNVRRQVILRHPRRRPEVPAQTMPIAILLESDYLNRDDAQSFRSGLDLEQRRYEFGPVPAPSRTESWSVADIAALLVHPGLSEVPYERGIDLLGPPQRRLLGRSRAWYWNDEEDEVAAFGTAGRRALPAFATSAALTPGLVADVYRTERDTAAELTALGYRLDDGLWWGADATQHYTTNFALPATRQNVDGGTSSVGYDPYELLAIETRDEMGNVATAVPDYWALAPRQRRDPNGVVEELTFDALGLPLTHVFDLGADRVGRPTLEISRDLLAWQRERLPRRVTRRGRPSVDAADADIATEVRLLDASGQPIESFVAAEPDPATGSARWAASGRIIRTADGVPARSYAPNWAASPALRPEAEIAAPMTRSRCDELGRVRTLLGADGTVQRFDYEPWRRTVADAVDCLHGSRWEDMRQRPDADPDQRAALAAAAASADTPGVAVLDAAGAVIRTMTDLGGGVVASIDELRDPNGQVVRVVDARGIAAESTTRDLLGRPIRVQSSASGETRTMFDGQGRAVALWGARGQLQRATYDLAGRLRERAFVRPDGTRRVVERRVYGDELADPPPFTRGRLVQHFDGAGRLHLSYDSRGNVVGTRRSLRSDITSGDVDWSPLSGIADEPVLSARAEPMLGEEFSTSTRYDDLSRPVSGVKPDGSAVRVGYGRRGLVSEVFAQPVDGAEQRVATLTRDAAGRRIGVGLGNDVIETFDYDDASGWLVGVRTTAASGTLLRDQRMVNDPVGNVVIVRDSAQQQQFFRNAVVTADRVFGYDAAYRLISASGREAAPRGPEGAWLSDAAETHYPDFSNAGVVQAYTETYSYDLAGNLESIHHVAPAQGWTARFVTAADSDRLVGVRDGRGSALPGAYRFDPAGNAVTLGSLTGLLWDDDDHLTSVDLGGGGVAHHAYDAFGERVHSVVVRGGSIRDETVRLDGWRRARRYTRRAVTNEVASLIVDDGDALGALVQHRSARGAAPVTEYRYQHSDAVGSITLETGVDGRPISYEEYRPYGGAAYRVVTPRLPDKVFRFAGAERDDDTGLDLHGVRCYAPWLGRWISADPAGMVDGPNRYWYGRDNPVRNTDPDGRQSVPRTLPPVPPTAPTPEIVSFQGNWGTHDPGLNASYSIPAPQRPSGPLPDYERSLLPTPAPALPPSSRTHTGHPVPAPHTVRPSPATRRADGADIVTPHAPVDAAAPPGYHGLRTQPTAADLELLHRDNGPPQWADWLANSLAEGGESLTHAAELGAGIPIRQVSGPLAAWAAGVRFTQAVLGVDFHGNPLSRERRVDAVTSFLANTATALLASIELPTTTSGSTGAGPTPSPVLAFAGARGTVAATRASDAAVPLALELAQLGRDIRRFVLPPMIAGVRMAMASPSAAGGGGSSGGSGASTPSSTGASTPPAGSGAPSPPAAGAPSAPGGSPPAPAVTGLARRETAGTGGIATIARQLDRKTGVTHTTITGRLQPTMPSRAGLERLFGPARSSLDRAHLWGRIFGDEAAAGVLYAPRGFNRGVQETLEHTLAELQDEARASGGEVWLQATNESHPRAVLNGRALAHVQYEFTVRLPGGQASRTLTIAFDVDPPGTPVTANRPGYRISAPFE